MTKGQRLILHQALHGYADGHRQLGLSTSLSPRDTKTLLMLSDISGPGASLTAEGYLTGFPLTESGMYALSRTWPAPEMSRPGCVWTHTLLIDFADLATIKSLAALLPAFRRPEVSSYTDYTKSLALKEQRAELPFLPEDLRWGKRLLTSLYDKPRNRVVTMRPDGVNDEALVLAVWSQQWPRLRRAFRFCTWAASDRSSEGNVFDLQLCPPIDRSVRTRFQGAVDLDSSPPVGVTWTDDANADLANPDIHGLRTFLHRLGGDVVHGREGFWPLCRLRRLVSDFDTDPEALGAAITLLEGHFGAGEARGARAVIVAGAIVRAKEIDSAALDFLLRNLDLADATSLEAGANSLGLSIWKRDPRLVLTLLANEDASRIIAERVLADLPADELADGLRRSPALMAHVLERRLDVVAQPAFWAIEEVDAGAVLAAVATVEHLHIGVLRAIISANRYDLAPRCIRQFGSFAVLQTLASLCDQNPGGQRISDWVAEALKDRTAVAKLLASDSALSKGFLVMVAKTLDPDAVPNEYGIDPWWTGMRQASGPIAAKDSVFLNAYLLCRALGRRSRNDADLACLSFEATHSAAERNELPHDIWLVLERHLPMVFFWSDWDYCPRLRAAVIDMFVDRRLAPEAFANLVKDDDLFLLLAIQSFRVARSRDFLKEVYRVMRNEPSDRFSVRIARLQRMFSEET